MADELFMRQAIALATEAEIAGEIPIGAIVVMDGVVAGCGRNSPVALNDPTAHAEILAIRDAARAAGNYRLEGATLYVTLEPCVMCAGALVNARIGRLVFGAADLKAGACGSLYNLGADPRLNHEFAVQAGVRAEECAALVGAFFAAKR